MNKLTLQERQWREFQSLMTNPRVRLHVNRQMGGYPIQSVDDHDFADALSVARRYNYISADVKSPNAVTRLKAALWMIRSGKPDHWLVENAKRDLRNRK